MFGHSKDLFPTPFVGSHNLQSAGNLSHTGQSWAEQGVPERREIHRASCFEHETL